MNSLQGFILRSIFQRSFLNPPTTLKRGTNRLYLLPRLVQPHVHGGSHITFVFRLQSTTGRPREPNGKGKKKPKRGNKKPELTEEEKKKEEERRKKQEKVVRDFNKFIGERKLEDWKKLCAVIGLEGEFRSIQDCREAIQTVNVNIYDVLEADRIIRAGGKARPRWFQTPGELSEYTVGTDKIYPKESVRKSEPEGAMLKWITNPAWEEKLQGMIKEKKRRKREDMLKKEKKANKAAKESYRRK